MLILDGQLAHVALFAEMFILDVCRTAHIRSLFAEMLILDRQLALQGIANSKEAVLVARMHRKMAKMHLLRVVPWPSASATYRQTG